MKPDYLDLSDGRKIRCDWNMNSLGEFTKLTGLEMTDLAEGKADITVLRTIAWCCAKEGEECDHKELGLSEKEFGRLMGMDSIIKFSEILVKQSGHEKKSSKGTFPQIFSRKKA